MKSDYVPACENCGHSTFAPADPHAIGAPRQLVCRRNPPSAFPINVGGQIGFASAQPTVPPGGLCGEWEARH